MFLHIILWTIRKQKKNVEKLSGYLNWIMNIFFVEKKFNDGISNIGSI